ncbi:PEPL1-like protein [Mya arenaria]|uniref:PEPL1-like protein n=1 Tax=Mya arenaria TaxID=6604 RepID=A0ABY7ET99_MYAAR|nr:PEPL1-like protein [Mya arenaria]
MWLNNATVASLPIKCSRHNTPSRSHSLYKLVKSCYAGGDEFVVVVCEKRDIFALTGAMARTLPLFNAKSTAPSIGRTVTVEFLLVGEDNKPLSNSDLSCLEALAHGVRLTAKIVDMPCADMHTDTFIEEVRAVGKDLGIVPRVIQGEECLDMGLGGIYNVGKAAEHAPALCYLSHTPDGAQKTVAWVGKGIVFDTGGLCIKSKVGMCTMKTDCGGAAAMLGAFYLAVKMRTCTSYSAWLRMLSGRKPSALMISLHFTQESKYHAGLVANNEDWEQACVKAGQVSGDLVHPVPYSPELHFPEFSSTVADMKNSVADRGNAQVSCAGLFIGSHLGFDFPGVWLHVDMAAPAHIGDRATGYGPALLNILFGAKSSNPLLQGLAPPGVIWERECMEVEDDVPSLKKVKLQPE